ncbi:MAG: nickel pincer cofactor biosynthesis protein LarC [Candidatus Dehalobacter alkaniphilus]
MKVIYYDCFSGISGDMNLGAMLDLGVPEDHLLAELAKLQINEQYTMNIRAESKHGIEGTRVEITVEDSVSHHSGQQGRTLADITKMIRESDLSAAMKDRSIRTFAILADAEAKVHGIKAEQVHFHEVGAVDAILDIVGSAVCLEYLQADRIVASSVELGGGFVRCEHGLLPVPAPAVTELLQGVPVKTGIVPFETTTPTGAAILAANVQEYTDNADLIIHRTGYGIGRRDLEIPNILRVYLGERAEKTAPGFRQQERQWILETNIDDMNPEFYEYIEEKMVAAGALDVFKTPVIMKKGRPGSKLSALVNKEGISAVGEVILRETSAIGLRSYPVEKTMLRRENMLVQTRHGPVNVKCSYLDAERIKSKPEYEDCKRLAREHDLPLSEIYAEVYRLLPKGNRSRALDQERKN